MMVIRIAITPSLNASNRVVFIVHHLRSRSYLSAAVYGDHHRPCRVVNPRTQGSAFGLTKVARPAKRESMLGNVDVADAEALVDLRYLGKPDDDLAHHHASLHVRILGDQPADLLD